MEKAKVLNQSEAEANKKVFAVFNLKKEDFETEPEFDDFLEQRERLIFTLVHDTNAAPEALAEVAEFRNAHSRKIEQRRAEQMEADRSRTGRVLPILGQIRYQTRASRTNQAKRAMLSVMYSDMSYISEMSRRGDEWQPGAEVPLGQAGGLSEELAMAKARQELRCSLFRSA